MTIEEFQKQWEQMESDKQTMSKEDFNKKYSTKKKSQPKYSGGEGRWEVGEYRWKQYNGHTLIKHCRAYFDIDAKTIKLVAPKDDVRHRYVPMFNRYFIVKNGDSKELWSCHRVRGTDKFDEGSPFKMMYDVTHLDVKQVIGYLSDGTFRDWTKTSDTPPKTYVKKEKYDVTTIGDCALSTEYDGISILVLMSQRPKGSYNYFLNMIMHEGGSVDENGIIHKSPDAPNVPRII